MMKKETNTFHRAGGFALDILLFFVVLAAMLVVTEAAFRFADVYPPLENNQKDEFRKGLDIFWIDPEVPIPLSVMPNKNVVTKIKGTSDTFTFRTNNMGMRSADVSPEKAKGVLRVLTMGDSWTYGEGVNNDETFTARLGVILNKALAQSGRSVEALNAGGVAGYSPDSYYIYLQRKGFALEPDIVIVATMPVNDLYDISDNEWPEKDASGLPLAVTSNILRVNDKGQYGYFQSRKKENPIMKPSRFPILNRLRLNTFYRDLLFRSYYLPYVLKNRSAGVGAQQKSGFENMKRYQLVIAGMNESCRARGVKFMLVLLPAYEFKNGSLTVNSTGIPEMVNFCRRKGIQTVNLQEVMLDKMRTPEGYDWLRYHNAANAHWNARGHEVAAEAIAQTMKKYGMTAK
jgi:hypothetical protein